MTTETASGRFGKDSHNATSRDCCLLELDRAFVVKLYTGDTDEVTNLEAYEYNVEKQLIPCDKEKLEPINLEKLFEKAQAYLSEDRCGTAQQQSELSDCKSTDLSEKWPGLETSLTVLAYPVSLAPRTTSVPSRNIPITALCPDAIS